MMIGEIVAGISAPAVASVEMTGVIEMMIEGIEILVEGVEDAGTRRLKNPLGLVENAILVRKLSKKKIGMTRQRQQPRKSLQKIIGMIHRPKMMLLMIFGTLRNDPGWLLLHLYFI
jgi:hypothetical protein